jgi:His-Xaa-Ser system radical SAM maturase HxsC
MLKLSTRDLAPLGEAEGKQFIAKLTENFQLPAPLRSKHILLIKNPKQFNVPSGFQAYFYLTIDEPLTSAPDLIPNGFLLPIDQSYLNEGDIVRFDPQKLTLRTLYRKESRHNGLLVTERCNNFCLMCSQPPKEADDSYLIAEWLEAIPLMDRGTKEIIITGGEPTLLNDNLVVLIRALKHYLPNTALHMLSNGRNFSNFKFAKKIASIAHPDLMTGIPIYSDVSNIHDYVVQADGAFDETIRGIINLKKLEQKVEIRVVLHKQTYERLPQLAEFLARNLLFVDHVALMGLEMTGFTRHNLEELWIDPVDYQAQLVTAVETLARYKMNVSIYNHQLCVLDNRLWQYNRKSISDWKNEYMPECEPCTKQAECGGFFSSAKLRYSSSIKPFG